MKGIEIKELEKYVEIALERGIELEVVGDNGNIRLKMHTIPRETTRIAVQAITF